MFFVIDGPVGAVQFWAESAQAAIQKYIAQFNVGGTDVASVTSRPGTAERQYGNWTTFGGPGDGAGGGAGEFEDDPAADRFSLERDLPYAEFLRHLGTLGQGFAPTSVTPGRRQQAAEAQFDPLLSLFRGQQVVGGRGGFGTGEEQATAFQNFLGARGGAAALTGAQQFPGTTSRELINQFRALGNLTGTPTDPLTAWQQEILAPTTSSGASVASGLGLSALGGTMSPLVGGFAAMPSEAELFQRWKAGQAGGTTTSFVDYIRNALGLRGISGGVGGTQAQGGFVA